MEKESAGRMKKGEHTCAPRAEFCAAPPAISFALWFCSRSSKIPICLSSARMASLALISYL